MGKCKNEYQHTGHRCGSFAVNNDPEFELCDVCYAYNAGLEAAAELRKRLDDATAYCSGEYPCEASTAEAFLEAEVGCLRRQLAARDERIAELTPIVEVLALEDCESFCGYHCEESKTSLVFDAKGECWPTRARKALGVKVGKL